MQALERHFTRLWRSCRHPCMIIWARLALLSVLFSYNLFSCQIGSYTLTVPRQVS